MTMENNETQAIESTQSGPTQEYVALEEARDADLDAFLETATKEEFAPSQPQVTEATEPKQEEKRETQPEKQPDLEVPPDNQVTRKDFEALKKQLDGLELINKRRTSELAETKRQLKSFIEAQSANLKDKWVVDPDEAYKASRQIERAEEKLEAVEKEEQTLVSSTQARQLIATHVGPEFDVGAMVESLKADGMPEQYLHSFVQDPYSAALPETLIQLAKRGVAERELVKTKTDMAKLVAFTKQLLEEKNKAPTDVLKKITSAMNQTPSITAANGGTGHPDRTGNVDPSLMNDEELDEFLRSK